MSRRFGRAVVALTIATATGAITAGCGAHGGTARAKDLNVLSAAYPTAAGMPRATPTTSTEPAAASSPSVSPPSTSRPQAARPLAQPAAETSHLSVPASQQIPADPNQIPDQVWLPADQVPLNMIFKWTWTQAPQAPYTGHPCGHQTFDQLGATAVVVDNGTQNITATDPHYNTFVAEQRLYFFPSAAVAEHAFATVSQDAAACQLASGSAPTAPGMHQTVTSDHALAVAGYPDPKPQDIGGAVRETHTYVAQRGPVLTVLTLATGSPDGTPNSDYRSVDDKAVLTSVADHLSAYGPE